MICPCESVQVLKHLALTSDKEELKLVKRRVLPICLELQGIKDCMKNQSPIAQRD
jgi:hypothetical protein